MFHDSHYVKFIVRRPFKIASPYRHPAPTDATAHFDLARPGVCCAATAPSEPPARGCATNHASSGHCGHASEQHRPRPRQRQQQHRQALCSGPAWPERVSAPRASWWPATRLAPTAPSTLHTLKTHPSGPQPLPGTSQRGLPHGAPTRATVQMVENSEKAMM